MRHKACTHGKKKSEQAKDKLSISCNLHETGAQDSSLVLCSFRVVPALEVYCRAGLGILGQFCVSVCSPIHLADGARHEKVLLAAAWVRPKSVSG